MICGGLFFFFAEFFLHLAVLILLIGMDRTVARIAFGPDKQQNILCAAALVNFVYELAGGIGGLAVNL